ncbi:rifin [Plasmodium sp. gorilla clade G1]|nr:rifin [Plasmodium sp. gorilla clade G1]
MKFHYSKILLFSLPLNILVSSSYADNKNKQYITLHTRTTTSRMLNEGDIYTSIHDKDPEMRSVKENFDRQTSQRFEEYEESITEKRKKYKEQRDKDIQKIILKDKMEKSLAQKVEKYCLRCGYGLGGVAAGVGIFGALGTYGWKVAATAAAYETAKQAGIQKGIEIGVPLAIQKLNTVVGISAIISPEQLPNMVAASYGKAQNIVDAINAVRNAWCDDVISFPTRESACTSDLLEISKFSREVGNAAIEAHMFGNQAATTETAAVKADELAKVAAASYDAYTAIGYSVTAILIIVLVMVIIYLILRYRRKKKMNRKGQYTKLLNE